MKQKLFICKRLANSFGKYGKIINIINRIFQLFYLILSLDGGDAYAEKDWNYRYDFAGRSSELDGYANVFVRI